MNPAQTRSTLWIFATLGILALLCANPAAAQQADRERAQMLQMQQQLQRLQSDNVAVQKERGELQTKAQEAEKAQKQSSQELTRSRQAAAALEKEKSGLRGELASTSDKLSAALSQIEFLKKDLASRDDTIREAANKNRHLYAELTLLLSRLKVQTGRADLCETKHDGVMKFTSGLIDRYEAERLRLCEPVTGIWKVRNEMQVQQFREELYGYRLDIPLPPQKAADATSSATPAASPRAAAALVPVVGTTVATSPGTDSGIAPAAASSAAAATANGAQPALPAAH